MAAGRSWIFLTVLLAVPVTVEAQISPDTRLFQRPEWDGTVFTGFCLDGQVRYQRWGRKWDKTSSWMVGPTLAVSFADTPELETGARFWWIDSDPKSVRSGAGFSDIDIWGKYQFVDDPVLLSAGLLLTVPTGAEKVLHPYASGEVNLELFGAGRFYAADTLVLIGHIGARLNSDMDYRHKDFELEYDGKPQFLVGTGVIYQTSPELDLLGEFNFATAAYQETGNAAELTGGLRYGFNEDCCGRAGLGIGFDDGSPKYELILSASAIF